MLPHRPDLDPLPDPPVASARARWKALLGLALATALGAGIGFLLGESSVDVGLEVGPFAAALVLGIPGAIAVHELGHVIGGQIAGWRFVLLIVGPVMVARDEGGLEWKLNKSLGLAGGLALSLPTSRSDLRRESALVVGGGPVASLALGALGVALGGAWAVVGLVSLGIGLVTLFPGRTSGFLTDGARLLRLLRGGAPADREAALLAVLAQSLSGVRPRDWDAGLLEVAAALEDSDPMETSAHALGTTLALDAGDADAARRHLARRVALWDATPPAIRGGLAADAALFEAAVRNDAERARAWLDRVPPRAALADPATDALARAATLRAEGDLEAARAAADESRATLSNPLALGSAEAVRDWLAGMGL